MKANRIHRFGSPDDAHTLTTRIAAVLPLAEARCAREVLEGARPCPHGKIVLSAGA
jgi:hypothetical protein